MFMSKLSIFMILFSMFFLSFNVIYFLSMLILFEFIIISMICFLFTYFKSMEIQFFIIYYLVVSVSESVLGLTLLIIMVESVGHENVSGYNLSSW